MIKCPSCSSEMKFDPTLQKVRCPAWANSYILEEFQVFIKGKSIETDIEDASSLIEKEYLGNELEGDVYKCKQCGATLMTFDNTAITFCSYCGSQAMLKDQMTKINNPDLVIPFKKTKDDFVKVYNNKIKKFFFAPKYMKDNIAVEKFRGIYIPYGVFDMGKDGRVGNLGKTYAYRRGDYIYYNDYRISSDVDVSYEGVSFDLVSKFYDSYSSTIPFNYKEAVPFDSSYMLGYYADVLDVDKKVYINQAKSIVEPDMSKRLAKDPIYRTHGCLNPTIDSSVKNSKVAMYPVYFLSIRDKKEQNVHYAIMNGQTGEVAMDMPVDFGKYLLVTLVLAAIIWAILIYTSFALTPIGLCIVALVCNVIALITSNGQLNDINAKLGNTNDEGVKYVSANNGEGKKSVIKKITDNKEKKVGKFGFLFKEVLAIILIIIALFSEAVSDMVYYTAAAIGLLVVVLTIKDLIKEHNMLSRNKLPQLEKRGGDENE